MVLFSIAKKTHKGKEEKKLNFQNLLLIGHAKKAGLFRSYSAEPSARLNQKLTIPRLPVGEFLD